jgi:hypothetical protein
VEIWDVEDDDDSYLDDLDDDEVDYDLIDEDLPPFDFAAVETIRYERGFVDDPLQIETGEGLRATMWTAPNIPQDLLETLKAERLDELDGDWGDPAALVPIQVDIILLETPDDEIVIEIRNRAHLLLATNDEEPRRLHRACGALEAAADRGEDVPVDTAMARAAAPDAPAFGLDDALLAHRRQKGTCELCGAEFTSAGAGRHLAACAPRHDAAAGQPQDLIHLRVTAPGAAGYWLDVEVRADAKLSALDAFLRDIWVECCGHLSGFEIGGVDYASQVSRDPLSRMFGRRPQRSMGVPMGKALAAADRFTYDYDYGSTTRLQLAVRGRRAGRAGRAGVRLLARNHPLVWPCATCGEPATRVCALCIHESSNPFTCDAHARRHPCERGKALSPVVNSPRMGVCGYAGRG